MLGVHGLKLHRKWHNESRGYFPYLIIFTSSIPATSIAAFTIFVVIKYFPFEYQQIE